ncbi:ABC transporter permease [Nonomuraea sp. SYSU D8015]|uniref:ABC transporter permease n=1 Tax=Nonomuraea sp. SYSU D8015 TaxID=2593644 RepID=UPI001CB75919|nr:ABC transporter permease subunit [Nonomuraea sp. SYSU D8015]
MRRPGSGVGGRTPPVLRIVPALLLLLLTVAGPLLAPQPMDRPVTIPYAAAGADGTLLGGDQLGRDVLSRLLHGGRDLVFSSLIVAALVTAVAAVLGVAGALRPRLGQVVERVADVLMLLPAVLGILLVTLSWPGGGRLALVVAAVALAIPYAVRFMAAAAAPVVVTGYVESAVASGERTWHLIFRDVLPNLRSTVLALFGLRFVSAVYVVATAAFLQIGPQPPEADWALMIRENSPGLVLNPWAVLAPSIAIGLLAMSVNLAAGALSPKAERT